MRAEERAEEAVDQREEDEDQPQPPPPAAGGGGEEEGMLSGSSAEEDWAGASTAAAAAGGAGEGSTAAGLGAGGAAGGAGVDELVGGREVVDDFWVRSANREGGDGERRAGGVSCGLGGEIGRWQNERPKVSIPSESSSRHRQFSSCTQRERERESRERRTVQELECILGLVRLLVRLVQRLLGDVVYAEIEVVEQREGLLGCAL